MFRIGIGTDIHRLEPGRPLTIGGVDIDSPIGAVGHSDADVLLHAITDAFLGAVAAGDIGMHFSDADERWKNADSLTFLRFAVAEASAKGYRPVNIDATVDLQTPKLRPYIEKMRANIAAAAGIALADVSVKAKTGENVGPVGESAAVTAQAVVLLQAAEI